MRNNKILPGHHGHEQIDEWFAQRAVSNTAARIISAFFSSSNALRVISFKLPMGVGTKTRDIIPKMACV